MSYNSYCNDVSNAHQLAFNSDQMSRKPRTTPRKLPQQDRSKVTVEAILTAAAHFDRARAITPARIALQNGRAVLARCISIFPNKEAIMTALRASCQ